MRFAKKKVSCLGCRQPLDDPEGILCDHCQQKARRLRPAGVCLPAWLTSSSSGAVIVLQRLLSCGHCRRLTPSSSLRCVSGVESMHD